MRFRWGWCTISKLLALVLSFTLTGCSSFLYYPTREEHVDRKKMPLQPEDMTITSGDGTKLHAWRFKSALKKPSPCVLVHFHGNAQNLSTHFYSFYTAPSQGYDYVIFDYRGYGSSEGKPFPRGTVEDGHAALRFVRDMYPGRPLVVVGQSLGGAVALRTVIDMKNEVPVKLVVVDSTFSSYRSVARKAMSRSWITWLLQPIAWLSMSDRYAPKGRLKEIAPIPLVVIHGDQDRGVEHELGREVFEEASEPKEFWHIPGGGHTDFMFREKGKYAEKFYDKLDAVCGAPTL
ncbi:MAG: alpha/beta hydrolase [Bdellovibrionota bacterium]